MHIIVLENEPSSHRAGQEISLFDICKGLSLKGHQITLLYRSEGNLLPQYGTFCIYLIPVHSYRLGQLGSTLSFLQDIRKVPILKNSLTYSNQYQDSFFGYSLALVRNIPFVCHLRLPPPPSLGFQCRVGMKGAKRLIATSNSTKKDWVQAGFRDTLIDVVHNGINPEEFVYEPNSVAIKARWNIPTNARVISYIGRLDKVKGLETLLKAFALLVETRRDIQLVIAGKPLIQNRNYKKFLEQLAVDLSISEKVTFLGYVDNPTDVYQVSDLTVLPSEWSEPFGRTIIESMSCEVPTVASRVGGIPEVLTDEFEQGLFQAKHIDELMTKLKNFIDWRSTDPELGKRCRQHILDNFQLSKTVGAIERALLSAIAG